jgi:hypothetical protein
MSKPELHVCPKCHASLPAGSWRCACGHVFSAPSPPEASAAEPQQHALYTQFLELKLRGAQRTLSHAMTEYARTPGSSKLSDKVDEAAREVARIENEIILHQARAKVAAAPSPGEPSPNERFRIAQVAKAEQAIRAAARAAPSPPPTRSVADTKTMTAPAKPEITANPAAPARVETPTPLPPAAPTPPPPAASAAPVTPATRRCPRCSLSVPLAASHCGCGYALPAPAPAAKKEDFLSKEELNALRHPTPRS